MKESPVRYFVIFVLAFIALGVYRSCNSPAPEPRRLNLYPSPTSEATQTPLVVEITTTPVPTYTKVVIIVTETPSHLDKLSVSAVVAVHLRPSPSKRNYPITALPNGTVLEDLGGRDGKWWFVQYGDKRGWVHSSFVVACNKVQE